LKEFQIQKRQNTAKESTGGVGSYRTSGNPSHNDGTQAMSQIADQITTEPYYCAIEDEIDLFEAAYAEKMPMMMKGPTGCGKTRFIDNKPWF